MSFLAALSITRPEVASELCGQLRVGDHRAASPRAHAFVPLSIPSVHPGSASRARVSPCGLAPMSPSSQTRCRAAHMLQARCVLQLKRYAHARRVTTLMRCRRLQTAALRLPVERVSASQMYGTRPRDGELDGAAADGGARHVYASRREGRGRRDSYGCRVPVPTLTMLRVLSALVADSQAARHVMQCFITAVLYRVLDCRRVRPALTGSAPSDDSTQPSRCLAQNFKSQHIKRWGEATNSRAVPVDEQSWRSVFLSSCYFDRLISSSGADRQASTSQPERQ